MWKSNFDNLIKDDLKDYMCAWDTYITQEQVCLRKVCIAVV